MSDGEARSQGDGGRPVKVRLDLAAATGPLRRAAPWAGLAGLAVALSALPPDHRGRVLATRGAMAAGAAIAASAIWRRRIAVGRRVADFFSEARDPRDLAVLRVVVAWQIWTSLWPELVRTFARLPRELQFPPATGVPSVGPLARLATWPTLPFAELPVDALLAGFPVVCLTAAVGLFSRASMAAAGLLFFVVFGILEWHRQFGHAHHLMWFAALLAASRCGDALSLDALVRRLRGRGPPPGPSAEYGTPLAFAMLLIGLVYLFPGLWKLWTSGVDWFLGDNLRYTIYREWWVRGGWESPIPIERYPALYKSAAAATVLFEVGFVFLLFHRRLRPLGAATGLGFHLISSVTMGIIFTGLMTCYVAFVEWGRLLRWLAGAQARPVIARAPPVAAVGVGACLVAGAVSAGVIRAGDGWPFAAYPLFDGIQGPTHPRLEIELVADGGTRRVEAHDYKNRYGYRWHQMLSRIVTQPEPVRARQMALFWGVFARDEPDFRDARRVRFFRVNEWITPERAHDPPASIELLFTWEPSRGGDDGP